MADGGEGESIRAKVYCQLPNADLTLLPNATCNDLLNLSHKELGIEAPIEQCRLLAYDATNHQVTGGIETGHTLSEAVTALDGHATFLLQMKTSSQPWTPYQSGGSFIFYPKNTYALSLVDEHSYGHSH
jgi:hypothetical protein